MQTCITLKYVFGTIFKSFLLISVLAGFAANLAEKTKNLIKNQLHKMSSLRNL